MERKELYAKKEVYDIYEVWQWRREDEETELDIHVGFGIEIKHS